MYVLVESDDNNTDPNFYPHEEQRPSGNIDYGYNFNFWYNSLDILNINNYVSWYYLL